MSKKKLYLNFLDSNDVLLQSFPRSGNTWARLLISNYIETLQQELNVPITMPSLKKSMEIIPTLEKIDITNYQFYAYLPYKIVKSHHIDDAPHCRAIYIYRHPADSLRSYVRFIEKQDLDSISKSRSAEILQKSMPEWESHLKYAIDMFQKRGSKLFWVTSYEKMQEDASRELVGFINFLGLPLAENTVELVVANNSIQNTKAAHQNTSIGQSKYFWNEGRVGLGRDYVKQFNCASDIENLVKYWDFLNKLIS